MSKPSRYKDLREFISLLKRDNDLLEISAPVDIHLELSEITDRISKLPPDKNKALLFNNPVGPDGKKYDIPVLINTMGSHSRMMTALGAECYEEIQKRIEFFVKPPKPTNLIDKLAMLDRKSVV